MAQGVIGALRVNAAAENDAVWLGAELRRFDSTHSGAMTGCPPVAGVNIRNRVEPLQCLLS
jgi:hypothetical protein